MRELGDAYAELFEVVRRNIEEPYNDENIARIFDRAADQVCVKCKFKNRCWNAEYVDTLSAMNDASCAMQEHGSLENTDFPGFFREKCVSLMPFVAAVNGELRAMAYRRQLIFSPWYNSGAVPLVQYFCRRALCIRKYCPQTSHSFG